MNREFERYLRELKAQVTHEIPEADEDSEPLVREKFGVKAKAVPQLGNQAANDLIKQRLESLLNEKNNIQARCDLLQEQFSALNAKYEAQIGEIQRLKIAAEAPATADLAIHRQLEEQGRELQHEVIRRQQETEAFQIQLKAQQRQTELLRMARDSAHTTVLDLQRKLEDHEHQFAEIEHQLQDETIRRQAAEAALELALKSVPSTPPPPETE